ncbi:dihydrofolate reductase family protein [Lentzea sp. NPDC004782]|uniref:dihydrofolate reductase family protein n=1 Tax=Lentzea sp. NPDC004782 TaxID=3154458 RepID=UPI0033BA02C5
MITHFVHQSADGFIEGPNGEFDWPLMGPEMSDHSLELSGQADTLLYGRRVWDMMSFFWPQAEQLDQSEHTLRYAPIWRESPKAVVSRTLTEAGWNTRVFNDPADLPDERMILFGGSALAASLTERDMIDEYLIFVHPVVLGGGKPVFSHPKRFDLELAESKVFDGRVVMLRYQR